MEPAELVRKMNGVASILRGASDLDGTLAAIVEATYEVPGTEVAALTWASSDETRPPAKLTDPTLAGLELLQDEVEHGPRLEALARQQLVWSNDLERDERWPDAGPKIAAMGFASVICVPLMGEHAPVATLSLYARNAGAFDEGARQVAFLLGSRTEAALTFATTVESLNDALDSRASIGAAVGIVMQRYSLDRDGAFRFLVRLSQNGNVKLRTVAEKLVESQEADSEDA